jgi:hypothetical protein
MRVEMKRPFPLVGEGREGGRTERRAAGATSSTPLTPNPSSQEEGEI